MHIYYIILDTFFEFLHIFFLKYILFQFWMQDFNIFYVLLISLSTKK